MKYILISLIRLYQFFHPLLHSLQYAVFGFASTCKYQERCSEYTLRQIKKHGTITGLKKGLRRILSCYSYAVHR